MNETFAFMLLLAVLSGAPHQKPPPGPAVPQAAYARTSASPGALVQRARRAAVPRLEQHPGARLPLEETFTDDAGRQVTLGSFFAGAPVLLVLGYYRCADLCSTLMDGLLQSVAALDLPANKYRVLAVSIDPDEDAPLAASKKDSYHALPGGALVRLDLLTGSAAAIARLMSVAGFEYAYDPARRAYLQPAGFLVANGEGNISRYFPDMRFDARDLRLALVQASRGAIGDLSDRFVLMCSRFDPATGRYRGMERRLVQTGGVLTLTLGTLSGALWLRRKRSRWG
jgi:protein SCO1/2